ncbi:MAG: metallophosphoesterase [Bdellovibrionales bacterium]|nr:metallophosphoesterase [Bdellovibrionales bacterium]
MEYGGRVIRIAAVGDLHYGTRPNPGFQESYAALIQEADVLLFAGDLTRTGRLEEIASFLEDIRYCRLPIFAVLGNHEYQSGQERRIADQMEDHGVRVLEGHSVEIQVRGFCLGIAGIKGFGGGFLGACGCEFGEPEMKLFASHARKQGKRLAESLEGLKGDFKVVLTHFSPIEGTLQGEKRELFPFLGSYHLAEPLDFFGVDLAIHGHAHRGQEQGVTSGGVPVRNVAYPVIRAPYRVYSLEPKARPMIKKNSWARTPESITS